MFKTIRIVLLSLLVLTPLPAEATASSNMAREKATAERIEPPLPPASSVVAVGPSLAGQPWRLEELAGEPLPGEETAPHILFKDTGDLVGFGGCNYFIGKYRTGDDGRAVVSSLRASHQQCPEASRRETTLLTSLVLANTLQIGDDGLTFFMDGNNLMKLRPAPDISVDELTRQGMLLKKHKARAHKASGKKKRAISKSKSHPQSAAPKTSGKTRKAAKKKVKPH